MVSPPTQQNAPRPRCGRYELLVRIGKGGMASVYLARVRAEAGFSRLYALKVLHPHLSEHPEFVHMLMDEARIASQLHHPHVVSTVDVGKDDKRHYLAMDYVEGVALDRLMRKNPERRPPELIVPVAIDALRGLHAAHKLRDESGTSLELVHRDVTPGNVIVGVDGTGRIADFGVAKARARITKTNPGIVKGKAGYIAPEVVLGKDVDGRADVFSMGVLLWNALTGENLFDTDDLASTLTKLVKMDVPPPSTVGLMPPAIFDAPILGALHRDPRHRHDTALEMAQALEDALMMQGQRIDREAIGEWVLETFGPQLEKRRRYAASPDGASWDPDQVEPPSTSALVRKDPTGKIVTAMPEPPADYVDDDPFAHTQVSEPSFAAVAEAEAALEEPPVARGKAGWIALAVAVLLVAGGAAAWWYAQRPEPTISARPLERPAPAPAPAAAPTVDLGQDVLGREEGAPPTPSPAARPDPAPPERAEPRSARTDVVSGPAHPAAGAAPTDRAAADRAPADRAAATATPDGTGPAGPIPGTAGTPPADTERAAPADETEAETVADPAPEPATTAGEATGVVSDPPATGEPAPERETTEPRG